MYLVVAIPCNIYNNTASNSLLQNLSKLYNIIVENNNVHFIKNCLQLINKIQNSSDFKDIKAYDFKDLFNNIDIDDLFAISSLIFK